MTAPQESPTLLVTEALAAIRAGDPSWERLAGRCLAPLRGAAQREPNSLLFGAVAMLESALRMRSGGRRREAEQALEECARILGSSRAERSRPP